MRASSLAWALRTACTVALAKAAVDRAPVVSASTSSGAAAAAPLGVDSTTATAPAFLPLARPGAYGIDEELQLVQLQVVFRHGDRSPLAEPSVDWPIQACQWTERLLLAQCPDSWAQMNGELERFGVRLAAPGHDERELETLRFRDRAGVWGQLTTLGSAQLAATGRALADYALATGLLPCEPGEAREALRVHATQFRRTVLSAASLVGGLVARVDECHLARAGASADTAPAPVSDATDEDARLGLVSTGDASAGVHVSRAGRVAIHVTPSMEAEVMFVNRHVCPKLAAMLTRLAASAEFKTSVDAGQETVIAALRARCERSVAAAHASGRAIGPRDLGLDALGDHVVCATSHGATFAELDVTASEMDALTTRLWRTWSGYLAAPGVARLAIGRLVVTLAANAARVVATADAQSVPLPRVVLYGCHDSTVAPLLSAFAAPVSAWPPYGAALVIELFRGATSMRYWVRVSYNGVPMRVLGAASELQSWDEFCARVEPISPTNYARECQCEPEPAHAPALASKL